jgi:hypothetical protein
VMAATVMHDPEQQMHRIWVQMRCVTVVDMLIARLEHAGCQKHVGSSHMLEQAFHVSVLKLQEPHHVPADLAAVVGDALLQQLRILLHLPPAPRVVPRPERQLVFLRRR